MKKFNVNAILHHEYVESCVMQYEAEAVVSFIDDPCFAGIEKTVLQKHGRCAMARDAMHGQNIAISCDHIMCLYGIALL